MKQKTLMLLWMLTMALGSAWAQGPNESGTYYSGADGLKGKALKTKLSSIIVNPRNVGYDGLYEWYKKTDTRPDGYVRDWYSNTTQYTHCVDNTGGYKKEGDMYNREHSVPQSWFSGSGIKSDIVHVLPTDGYVNNRRGNSPFGEVNNVTYQSNNGYSKLGSCKTEGYSGTVFEPNDEIKGDMARIYFYMITRYESSCGSWGHDVFTNDYPGLTTWTLKMMMRWSKQDPVDDVEIARNKAVYEAQGNRNPYVDYPGLEEYTWGSKMDVAFSYDNYKEPDNTDPDTPDPDTPDPDNPDPDNPDPDNPDDPIASGTTFSLNNVFFEATDWSGTQPSGASDQLKVTEGNLTVTYDKGTGSNMYCSDAQIRLYPGNTLTFEVTGTTITELDFTGAQEDRQKLTADVGTLTDNVWKGDAKKVVISVTPTGSSTGGHVKVPSVVIKVKDTSGISEVSTIAPFEVEAIYAPDGRRRTKLQPGINIVRVKGGKLLKLIGK